MLLLAMVFITGIESLGLDSQKLAFPQCDGGTVLAQHSQHQWVPSLGY